MKLLQIVVVLLIAYYVYLFLNKKEQTQEELFTRLKYFKPIINDGLFGTTITWVMRETPLTDEQLSKLVL